MVFLLVFAVVLLHLFGGVLILVGGFLFIVMISGVLLAGVVFLLDVGLAVFLLPRRDIITNLVVGAVGFFRYRKFYSAGRIAGVDFLAIFLVKSSSSKSSSSPSVSAPPMPTPGGNVSAATSVSTPSMTSSSPPLSLASLSPSSSARTLAASSSSASARVAS